MLNVTEQEADPQSLLNFIKDLIAVRKDHLEIAKGALEWVDTDNPAVAAFVRRLEDKALFAVFNLADRTAGARIPREIRQQHRMDLLGGYLRLQPDLTNVTLKPYQFAWFVV
jgi:maltose alpha-D-glucosyltransferase/alpha-amylase